MIPSARIAHLLRAAEGGDDDAVLRFFARQGWGHAAREVHGRVGRSRLLELSWADEPQALVVLGGSRDRAGTASLGYSREAPYTLTWSSDRLALLDSRYWRSTPGDSPLLSAEVGDRWAVAELLSFLGPEQLLADLPGGYGAPAERQRELHRTLAAALAELRLQVADAGLLSDLDPGERDAEVLRLFHQLLFIRFQEDRGHAASDVRLRDLSPAEDLRGPVAQALRDYRAKLNSELFAPVGIEVGELPPQPLADVLVKLVEPWKRLRLNFSISRSEIAGRLYQSYLASLPARKPKGRQGAFFDAAHAVDAQAVNASYYTPPGLARLVVERTLVPWLRSAQPRTPAEVRVLDPACGSGAFLIAAYRALLRYFAELKGGELTPAERSKLLLQSIFGADVDERAIELARVQLLEEADVRGRLPVLGENLLLGDSLLAPPGEAGRSGEAAPAGAVDWSAALPEDHGFDVVLTNPPFQAHYKQGSKVGKRQAARLAELYPSVQAGHADYSHLFVDLALRLLGPDGVAGFVLPAGVVRKDSAAPVRELLAERGLRSVVDFDAGRLFDADTYVCTVSTGGSRTTELLRAKGLSRDGRVLLEAAEREDTELMRRQRISRRALAAEAERGWDPFRLQWELELREEVAVELSPLAPPGDARRIARYGTKPGRQADFIVAAGEWQRAGRDAIAVGERVIPEIYLPPLVKGGQLFPFHFADSGARLFVPFETDGSLSDHAAVCAELESRGGLPRNSQRGDLAVLRGPKLLVRTLAREATTVADPRGELMPLMGEAGAIAVHLGDVSPDELAAYEALLNSSFYQWWLGEIALPRQGGWLALNVSLVGSIPVPALRAAERGRLVRFSAAVRDALNEPGPLQRRDAYHRELGRLDEFVLDRLGASPRLREVVAEEVRRSV
jgi:SAM-dependent methyltransferase